MALEGTHIRFALDLKQQFQVSNVCEYLAGTIYPDSRYVTGIDRNLTHPKDLFERKRTELSDFEKGWLVHLICDDTQYGITMELFPEIRAMEEGQGNARWLHHTGLKILQDLDDIQKFDITSHLKCLEHVENPNGEDLGRVSAYNAIFTSMYTDPSKINLESFYDMWRKFNIGDELVAKLREVVEKQAADSRITSLIPGLYKEMLVRAAQSAGPS